MTFREALKILFSDGGWIDFMGVLLWILSGAGMWIIFYLMGAK